MMCFVTAMEIGDRPRLYEDTTTVGDRNRALRSLSGVITKSVDFILNHFCGMENPSSPFWTTRMESIRTIGRRICNSFAQIAILKTVKPVEVRTKVERKNLPVVLRKSIVMANAIT